MDIFHFFDHGQNFHNLSGDKIKCLIIGHPSASVDFLRVVQFPGRLIGMYAFMYLELTKHSSSTKIKETMVLYLILFIHI